MMFSFIRRPVVRSNASGHIYLMMIAFAISVVVTRLYLELTGYPQIGNETFHIAHALWGGLLLIIASFLMLIYVNRWVGSLSAVLSGMGVGLFIDEVGKFITQQNDYFFPLAAPIIYIAFLLTLLVYLIVKRQASKSVRADMYALLSDMEEVLENDLSVTEHELVMSRLQRIAGQNERPDLAELAGHLLAFFQSGKIRMVAEHESAFSRLILRFRQFEDRLFSQSRSRLILVIIYLITGVSALVSLVFLAVLITGSRSLQPEALQQLLKLIILEQDNIASAASLNWYLVLICLEVVTGVLVLVGLVALLIKRESSAITLGIIATIITLVFTNTLSFYFNQFSIMLNSIYLFLTLAFLQRYRDRFLNTTL